ncbi:hypothetical protein NE237_032946 [Protea cynaroides]|uniref:Uncharacterized protein n=1 Tax=Protea cynaroides TaxID=273540 RepID=A0A9Q0R3V7_9MAGN|nr:hypothetical protein NE237_032946 [Protea cynaroides]
MEHSWESSSISRDEKVEPIELFEEKWFFNNLFLRTAMVRCASDPTSSLSICQEMTAKSLGDKRSSSITEVPRNLLRSPSLPPCIGRPESAEADHSNQQSSVIITSEVLPPRQTSKNMMQDTSVGSHGVQKESKVDNPNKDIENPGKQSSSITEGLWVDGPVHHDLARTPSLPSSVGKEKVAVMEEDGHGSRKLMRQLSFNPSSFLPPQHKYKTMAPRHRLRRETKVDVTNKGSEKLSRRKTMGDLEIEELRGFMELGFTFNEEDLNPSVVNLIPGLRTRSEENLDEDKERRPYLSEAWTEQKSAPLMPNLVEKKSVGDIKEQLKYWAQAVASNVRQEC